MNKTLSESINETIKKTRVFSKSSPVGRFGRTTVLWATNNKDGLVFDKMSGELMIVMDIDSTNSKVTGAFRSIEQAVKSAEEKGLTFSTAGLQKLKEFWG